MAESTGANSGSAAVWNIETPVSELSIDFDDYRPEARQRHEGKSLFVGLHVPIEHAKHLTLSSVVTIVITERTPSLPPATCCQYAPLPGPCPAHDSPIPPRSTDGEPS